MFYQIKHAKTLHSLTQRSMSSQDEKEFDAFNNECKHIANRKHGDLAKMLKQRDNSKQMCRVGVFLSPLLVGIPLAWMECKRNVLLKQKIPRINTQWNQTYQKCMARKQRESQSK